MNPDDKKHRDILLDIAQRAMIARDLLPEFPDEVTAELEKIPRPAVMDGESVRDLRNLLWCSVDNDDSLDLDQLAVAEALSEDSTTILVAVADVDALVKKGSAIDEYAQHNTTSVYTAAKIFPMLPERLSTDLTSLNPDEDRLAMVIEMVIGADGSVQESDVYRACVRNHAKLAYNSVGAWLEGNDPAPEALTAVDGLAENLRLQDAAAQRIRHYRHFQGSLSLETVEARPVIEDDEVRDLKATERNRATDIIEDFMIAANGVTSRYLSSRGLPSIRRVVRIPRRWDRIVAIAAERKFKLPDQPDSKALEEFLDKEKAADPLRFPDLSLTIIKLLGAGEYVAERPGDEAPGHFGLAVPDYAHSTAPNRRYPDLIVHRLLKAALTGEPSPYDVDELDALAEHCTRTENEVNKVQRQVGKSAAALLLRSRVGEQFDAIITGASSKGTWARLLDLPVEGKVVAKHGGLDVGDRTAVRLLSVNVERGFIDFERVRPKSKRRRRR